jgi:hypothetical protein
MLDTAFNLPQRDDTPGLDVELLFYAFVHRSGQKSEDALRELKRSLIEKNHRSLNWNLSRHIEYAINHNNPDADWISILAQVITNGRNVSDLNSWKRWKAIKLTDNGAAR